MKWKYCANCGHKLETGWNFCPRCAHMIGTYGLSNQQVFVGPGWSPNTDPKYQTGMQCLSDSETVIQTLPIPHDFGKSGLA